MSFWGNLFNQVNPFDNGKTFSNPNGAPPKPPQPLPPQPQRPAQPQVNMQALLQALHSGGLQSNTPRVNPQLVTPNIAGLVPGVQTPHPSTISQIGHGLAGGLEQGVAQIAQGFEQTPGLNSIANALLFGNKNPRQAALQAIQQTQKYGKNQITAGGGKGVANVAEQIGSMTPGLAASVVNPAAGISAFYGQGTGSTYNAIKDSGGSQARARAGGVVAGVPMALAGYLGAKGILNPSSIYGGIAGKISPEVGSAVESGLNKLASNGVSNFMANRILSAPIEYGVGAAQQLGTNAGMKVGGVKGVGIGDNLNSAGKQNLLASEIMGSATDLAPHVAQAIQNHTPDAVVHRALLQVSPEYQSVVDSAQQKLDMIGRYNQGGKQPPKYLMDGYNHDLNTMQCMRSKTLEIGAVGKNVNIPTQEELSAGKALGMSPTDVAKAKADYLANQQPVVAKPEATRTPREVSAAIKTELAGQTPLAPKDVNTAANPIKIDIPSVAQGDYAKARSNGQLASKPVEFSGTRWQESMRKLSKDEKANFWKSVENPNARLSPQVKDAIAKWNDVSNRAHATSQALGGNTNFVKDYGLHPWDKSGWTIDTPGGNGSGMFTGLNNMSRKYQTIAEGEAKGLKLGADPVKEGNAYISAASSRLRKEALIKGLSEADAGQATKPHTIDFGYGKTVALSDLGRKESKGVLPNPKSDNALLNGYRKVNRGAKEGILSASQFHTINVGGLRAAPTLIAEGHPIAAIKGLYGMARDALGTGSSERRMNAALKDGMVEKASRIGMPYGASDYATTGQIVGRGGIGEHTVFGKQMPAMHDQVVRSVVADLQKKGISLDSPQARQAGLVGNKLMGFINTEVQNLDPKVQRALGDLAFAPQFTRSGFELFKDAGKGGVGGSYARRGIAANVVASTAVIAGVGALMGQKSDNVRDSLLRALVDPAIATPNQDSKGNTIKLKTPGTLTSNVAKVLGIKLVRQSDGHLGVSWNPGNLPSTVADYMRSHLAVVPATGLKLATNQNYANKPMYDPNAPAGTQAIQAGTTVAQGLLPISLQGALNTNAVKSHLPQAAQDVLNANAPGGNPLVKSLLSSIGATPTTDKTVGKGLQTDQYFSALDQAKKGLNSQEQAALQIYAGSKKNPVTGKYDVQPNVNDTSAKAKTLLQNPKVIDNLVTMNQKLAGQGQKVDPLWQLPTDQITKVLQYQSMPPGSADKTHWMAQNKDWYTPLTAARSNFFNTLPAGDPNKPAQPIEYPTATPAVAQKQQTFFALPDATSRAKYIASNPDLQQQLDNQVAYTNKLREAQGYSALDTYPTPTPQVQSIINAYNAIPKGGGKNGGNLYRSQWITAHPQQYAAMSQYFTQAALYGAQQSLTQAQFKDTGVSQAGLKDISNLGQYDIGKTTDVNGNTLYALNGQGSGGSGGSKYAGFPHRTAVALPRVPNKVRVAVSKSPKIRTSGAKTTKFATVKFAKPRRIKV